MPLELLVLMVVVGILGIAFTLHFLGLTDGPGLADEDAARAAWLREFPKPAPRAPWPQRALTRCELRGGFHHLGQAFRDFRAGTVDREGGLRPCAQHRHVQPDPRGVS